MRKNRTKIFIKTLRRRQNHFNWFNHVVAQLRRSQTVYQRVQALAGTDAEVRYYSEPVVQHFVTGFRLGNVGNYRPL